MPNRLKRLTAIAERHGWRRTGNGAEPWSVRWHSHGLFQAGLVTEDQTWFVVATGEHHDSEADALAAALRLYGVRTGKRGRRDVIDAIGDALPSWFDRALDAVIAALVDAAIEGIDADGDGVVEPDEVVSYVLHRVMERVQRSVARAQRRGLVVDDD